MKVGDTVKIDKCTICAAVVGKTAKIKGFVDDIVELNYGRGRPQLNRPTEVHVDNVSLVKEED